MTRYSLDTDTVSAILKHDPVVVGRLNSKIVVNHEIIICPFVYYEVKRGLLDKGAPRQMEALENFVYPKPWFEFDRKIWNAAAEGWAKAKKVGAHHKDPDLLIAYHAIHFDAVVVTSNTKHFSQYTKNLEDWRGG